MVGGDVVAGDLFAGLDVAKRHEQEMSTSGAHVAVWLARVIHIVKPVAPSASIDTPFAIDGAHTVMLSSPDSSRGFAVSDALARVFRNLFSASKKPARKAASTSDV
jgi:hypothetical protein